MELITQLFALRNIPILISTPYSFQISALYARLFFHQLIIFDQSEHKLIRREQSLSIPVLLQFYHSFLRGITSLIQAKNQLLSIPFPSRTISASAPVRSITVEGTFPP